MYRSKICLTAHYATVPYLTAATLASKELSNHKLLIYMQAKEI
jgi:hypothetical protein